MARVSTSFVVQILADTSRLERGDVESAGWTLDRKNTSDDASSRMVVPPDNSTQCTGTTNTLANKIPNPKTMVIEKLNRQP